MNTYISILTVMTIVFAVLSVMISIHYVIKLRKEIIKIKVCGLSKKERRKRYIDFIFSFSQLLEYIIVFISLFVTFVCGHPLFGMINKTIFAKEYDVPQRVISIENEVVDSNNDKFEINEGEHVISAYLDMARSVYEASKTAPLFIKLEDGKKGEFDTVVITHTPMISDDNKMYFLFNQGLSTCCEGEKILVTYYYLKYKVVE